MLAHFSQALKQILGANWITCKTNDLLVYYLGQQRKIDFSDPFELILSAEQISYSLQCSRTARVRVAARAFDRAFQRVANLLHKMKNKTNLID